jgi:ATP-dependent RNA helicase SUPV3L1/SUV3
MTSLTGASGEEFASILRALGYRMERRPKPPEESREKPATSAAIDNAGAGTTSEAGEASAADEADGSSDHVEASLPLADLAGTPPGPAAATGASELVVAAEPMRIAPEVASATDQAAPSPVGDIAPPQEPDMIEIWRPSRADGRWRGRSRQQTRTRRTQKQPAAAQPAEQADTTALRAGSPPEATEPPGGSSVQTRPRQHGRKRHKPEHRADRAQHDRPASKRFERREKLPDPNSPFAKLAGLKAQLEADAKERPKERR